MEYKKFLLCVLVAQTSCIATDAHKIHPISVPSFIDGAPFGINGHEIEKLLYILKQVEKLHHGVLNKSVNERVGKYTFRGSRHTVSQLAEIERAGVSQQEVPEMRALLHTAKEDFMRVALPFVEQARGVKAITLKFIEEWAHKHHRLPSYLLDWSKEEDGHELEAFTSNVQSFRQLEEFCVDLMSFIADLVRSCERGWGQYQEIKKSRKK